MNEIMLVIHSTYEYGNPKSRLSQIGNLFLSKMFNALFGLSDIKQMAPIIHEKIVVCYMLEL